MPRLSLRLVIAQALAMLAVLAVVLPMEWEHWKASQLPGANWFFGIPDTTIPLLLIVSLPYFWLVRRPFAAPVGSWWSLFTTWWTDGPNSGRRGVVAAALLIAVTSLWLSYEVSATPARGYEQYRVSDLPPAIHDEFSYRFQAETYLAGRWSFASHPTAAPLFDQMHVVNEGRFASRYFPSTGLWIAPWLWLGWPLLGHWLAGAATCVFVFAIGRELSNNGTGLVAGMLTALAPGMALFSNLLLAHHPTLMGLSLFAWTFLRWQRRGRLLDVTLAGCSLTWAMLCRPMTAAGFALPFGVVFVATLWRVGRGVVGATPTGLVPVVYWPSHYLLPTSHTSSQLSSAKANEPPTQGRWGEDRLRFGLLWPHLLAMAVPLLAGFVVLALHNHAITGSFTKSAYQLFNDVYTPRHGYGFNNVVRGEQHLGPRVLDQYDRWAENLTPQLAATNTLDRLLSSWQWTVGLVPLLAGVLVFLVTGPSRDRRWWLIFASVVSLFAAHVPYWFVGMFNYHYVFESGPLWCLLLAAATDTLATSWLAVERPRMPVWWTLGLVAAVAMNLLDGTPFWYSSKLQRYGVEMVTFSKIKYQFVEELIARDIRQRPALLLIEADPDDRHIDYVFNHPSLSADVLRARYPVPGWSLDRIAAEFPDRTVYLFRAKTGELGQLARGAPSK